MRSSDRRIAVAKKLTPEEEHPRDTWPVPPPSSIPQSGEGGHDTIPTPPPSSGVVTEVRVPALRSVDIEDIEVDVDEDV